MSSNRHAALAFDEATLRRGYDSEEADEARAKLERARDSAKKPKSAHNRAKSSGRSVVELVPVPNEALGKLLDGSRTGAHAVKLLAIKVYRSQTKPSWALNVRFCHAHYGVSRRLFKSGLAHMKKSGVLLERELHGRAYATEAPIDVGASRYVLLDEALLTRSPAFVAFVLAANLSPRQQPATKVARRIGVKSPTTVRKLTAEAEKAGAIATSIGERGAVIVARRGYIFDLAKNGPVKNEPVKNGPTHRGKKLRQNTNEITPERDEKNLGHDTRCHARRDSLENADASDDRWRWITLTDWRHSNGIAERELLAPEPAEAYMPLQQWRVWLDDFGVAIPAHLKTPAAHRQATELANELVAHEESDFSGWQAMQGIASLVAKACAEGRVIRSLGFIAERILRQMDCGSLAAVCDRAPSIGRRSQFDEASELAWEMTSALETYDGFPFSSCRLLSTSAIEGLVDLIDAHGRDSIVDLFNHAMQANRRPDEGRMVTGWSWFEESIRASRSKRRGRSSRSLPSSPIANPDKDAAMRAGARAPFAKSSGPSQGRVYAECPF